MLRNLQGFRENFTHEEHRRVRKRFGTTAEGNIKMCVVKRALCENQSNWDEQKGLHQNQAKK